MLLVCKVWEEEIGRILKRLWTDLEKEMGIGVGSAKMWWCPCAGNDEELLEKYRQRLPWADHVILCTNMGLGTMKWKRGEVEKTATVT
jgi:hypothetical protein